MEALINLLNNVVQLNENEVLHTVYKKDDVKEEIIRLNTEDQLWSEGIDSNDESLGVYRNYTIELKKLKGDPYDRVTLKDEGDFYDSFRVISNKTDFEIVADTEKDDVDLSEKYGNDILGLTVENKGYLNEFIQEDIITEIREKITKGL